MLASIIRFVIVMGIVLLCSIECSKAQPKGWYRTTEEDKAFEADWMTCVSQTRKVVLVPVPPREQSTLHLATPLGVAFGLSTYGEWQQPPSRKPVYTNNYPAAIACMKQRGWSRTK